jgi:hypothetical protein
MRPDNLEAQSVDTDQATVGSSSNATADGQEIMGNQQVGVDVPGDYADPQAAVNDVVPAHPRHKITIDVNSGDYSSQDLVIPLATPGGIDSSEIPRVRLIGDTGSPIPLRSITATGMTGTSNPVIQGFEIQDSQPYTADNAGILLYGCNAFISDCNFAASPSATDPQGIELFGGFSTVRGSIDVGTGWDTMVNTKRMANVVIQDGGGSFTGSPGFAFVRPGSGVVHVDTTAFPGSPQTVGQGGKSGIVVDWDSGFIYEPTVEPPLKIQGDTEGQFTIQNEGTASTRGTWDFQIRDNGTIQLRDVEASQVPFAIDRGGDVELRMTSAYSPSNVTTTRSFDADNTTVAELADVVGTIIDDLAMDISA